MLLTIIKKHTSSATVHNDIVVVEWQGGAGLCAGRCSIMCADGVTEMAIDHN